MDNIIFSKITSFQKLEYKTIDNNYIVCKKTDDKANTGYDNILADTINIGRLIENGNVMKKITKSCNNSLLDEKDLTLLSNIKDSLIPVSNKQLKGLIKKQIDKLNEILENSVDYSEVNNYKALERCNEFKELEKRIQQWFNNYGQYLEQKSDDIQYYDLYLFLDKCLNYYHIYSEKADIPSVKYQSHVISNRREGYNRIIEFDSIFDLIYFQMQNYFVNKDKYSICQYCGNIFFNRNHSAKYCSDSCKTKAYIHRKKVENDNSIKEG